MKKGRIWLIAAAVLILCAVFAAAGAETITAKPYVCEILSEEERTAQIIRFDPSGTPLAEEEEIGLVIPAELEGYRIVAIAADTFKRFSKRSLLTWVTISEGIESIGVRAFNGCDGLKEIHLPDTLTSLGSKAFSNCKGLTEVELPAGLKTLGAENPFALCDNLTKMTIRGDAEESVLEVRDGMLVDREKQRLICYLRTSRDGSFTVPGDIRVIGNAAFLGCTDLTKVTLSEGIEMIEDSAFKQCYSIPEIVFPSSLSQIGMRSFAIRMPPVFLFNPFSRIHGILSVLQPG